jgi:polysaccharide export outer membrane protein
MNLSVKAVFALFLAAALLAGQTNTPVAPPTLPEAQGPPPAKRSAAASAGAPAPANSGIDPKPYVIGPLDVLFVRVWNNQNLTGMVDVGPDGMISVALIGQVKADGLTIEQLKETLRTKLSDFIESPEVSVDVTRINSKRYFIIGGVNRPGPYPLASRTTVSEALSNAGGFSGFANQKRIYVLRGTHKFYFNFKEVIDGKHLEQDIPLENGDKIYVPE